MQNSVNEIFDPDRVDRIFSQSPATRASSIALDRGTNYGVVRLSLLEHLYEKLYMQRLHDGNDSSKWRCQILSQRNVISATQAKEGKGVVLRMRNGEREGDDEELEVDYVFVATGYVRNAHEEMLKGVEGVKGGKEGKWSVRRDYRVQLDEEKVDRRAGIWLQGCNEETHGVSFVLFFSMVRIWLILAF